MSRPRSAAEMTNSPRSSQSGGLPSTTERRIPSTTDLTDQVPDVDTSGVDEMEGHMINVRETMEREFSKIRNEYERLMRLKQELDAIRRRIRDVSVDERDRVRLNVSGRRFEIRASSVLKNTFFRSLLSGSFVSPDPDGFYFIDRDPEFVQTVLNFLRDGSVDISRVTTNDLPALRRDADFYMVQDLVAAVDIAIAARANAAAALESGFNNASLATTASMGTASSGTAPVALNTQRPVTHAFHGIGFEVIINKPNFRVLSMSFIAGTAKKLTVEVYYKEGPADNSTNWRKIGDFEGNVEKGVLVPLSISQSLALSSGVHSFVVYTSSSSSGIAVCPRRDGIRQTHAFQLGRSYHIEDSKGQIGRKNSWDEYDFSGDLVVSFQ
eukprot:PhF_6_TR42699/c0_g1_i5/m.64473